MNQETVTAGETHAGNTMDTGGPVTTFVTWEIQEVEKNSLKRGDMKSKLPLLNFQCI